ncbi:hypothetical protein PTKIN_Ptkin15bG0104300 [Pterospermum kingtungense]
MEVVKRSWQVKVSGNLMEVLFSKLKRLKLVLKDFNRRYFSNISNRVAQKMRSLEDIQALIMAGQGNEKLLELENQAIADLIDLLKAEESFYRQKSRIQWLIKGDSNTKFFHKLEKAQYTHSLMLLKDDNGNTLSSHEDISEATMNNF